MHESYRNVDVFNFAVLLDNKKPATFSELDRSDTHRTIMIQIPKGTERFDVIGTQVMPKLSDALKPVGNEVADKSISVATKQKKALTLISVKNIKADEVFEIKIRNTDGSIKFAKVKGWEREKIDQSTVVVSSNDRPLTTGRSLIILLMTDNLNASLEWSAINNDGVAIAKGVAVSK